MENRIEEIRQRVREFKVQQESLIYEGRNRAEQEAEKTYGNMSVKNDMSYLLSVDVLITPYISNTEWPSALVTNFGDKCADLGTMESSGSLWKLIKREGLSYDGLFVVLQSAEIGEKISYLRSDLTMSPELSKAAVWMVKSLSASDYNEYTKPVFAYGALVQFELVCDDSSADSIHRALAYREKVNKMPFQPGQPRFEESLLVAASSSTGSGEKGIAILNQSERDASLDYKWTLTWQVAREDTNVEGFEFLEEVLEEA